MFVFPSLWVCQVFFPEQLGTSETKLKRVCLSERCRLCSAAWHEIFNLRQDCTLIYVYVTVQSPCRIVAFGVADLRFVMNYNIDLP